MLSYGNENIPYSVVTNKKLKNLYITIDPIFGVIVKNPNFPLSYVHSLVEKKANWIAKKLHHTKKRISIKSIYENEKKVLLYGKKESLHIKQSLADFYKQKSAETIPTMVEKWALKMHVSPTKITFRKTKRRWGSCSCKNELSFTSSLIQLPQKCIDYIIVHELSHIKHKHHQKSFWLHVAKFMPEFKEYEKILKNYSPQI